GTSMLEVAAGISWTLGRKQRNVQPLRGHAHGIVERCKDGLTLKCKLYVDGIISCQFIGACESCQRPDVIEGHRLLHRNAQAVEPIKNVVQCPGIETVAAHVGGK